MIPLTKTFSVSFPNGYRSSNYCTPSVSALKRGNTEGFSIPVGNVQLAEDQSSSFYKYAPDLFNGNIRNMKVGIKKLDNPIGYYTYGYDQLNRIVKMDAWKDEETISEKYKERVTYDPNGNIMSYLRHNDEGIPMDSLTYNYADNDNKLQYIRDREPNNVNAQDIDDQKGDNYIYDCSGNLIENKSDNIKINWNPFGTLTDIKYNGKANFLSYGYDPMQNRALKVSGTGSTETKTYYFRDAQGNVLATYCLKNNVLTLEEVDIYGSSRLGLLKPNLQLYPSVSTENKDIEGQKRYELSNHLGNVLAVISDRKKGMSNIGSNYAYFDAVTLTATDYYPFGMALPGRSFHIKEHKYSFNGMEKENELEGIFTTHFRQLDVRTGRWISMDPAASRFANQSPYSFVFNAPTISTDVNGDCPDGNCGDREVVVADQIVRKTYDSHKSIEENMKNLRTAVGEYIASGSKSSKKTFVLSSKNEVTNGTGDAFNAFNDLSNALMSDKIKGHFLSNDAALINNYDESIKSAPNNQEAARLIGERSGFINSEYGKAKVFLGEVAEYQIALTGYSVGQMLSGIQSSTRNTNFSIGRSGGTNNYISNSIAKKVSPQKQARHLQGGKGAEGKSYFNKLSDAQSVLDAIHSGKAVFLGVTKQNQLVYRYNGITGYNVNPGRNIISEPTNTFFLKGSVSPSIVPTSPNMYFPY